MNAIAALRQARDDAHRVFDSLWMRGPRGNWEQQRRRAYCWLAFAMGIEIKDCHFSLFNLGQCHRATMLASCRLESLKETEQLCREIKAPFAGIQAPRKRNRKKWDGGRKRRTDWDRDT